MNNTVVLAYSGGLDTTAMIPYLKERHGCDVVAMLVDAGRVTGIEALMERAKAAGAVDAVVVDAKEEFARHYARTRSSRFRYGPSRLARALRRLGIGEEAAERAIRVAF